MGRFRSAEVGAAGIGVNVLAGALVGLFIVVMLAGGVYRTECTFDTGQHTTSWGLEGDIPYLWSPGDGHCQAHTLTRYVLGKVGVMTDIGR